MAFKKVGAPIAITGQIASQTYSGVENRIQLFDGKFTTGYRVIGFTVTPNQPLSEHYIMGLVSTEPKADLAYWDFSDIEEVAWSTWNLSSGGDGTFAWGKARVDNMAVEDLWIRCYDAGEGDPVNYEIILQKYEFDAWRGALGMVRNRSQA